MGDSQGGALPAESYVFPTTSSFSHPHGNNDTLGMVKEGWRWREVIIELE